MCVTPAPCGPEAVLKLRTVTRAFLSCSRSEVLRRPSGPRECEQFRRGCLPCLPACCPEFLWMWHLQGSDSLADSLHQSQALWLALHESQLRGGRQGPLWGRQACSPHHSRAMEQSLCARPRASWASVLWSVHIFHLVCAGQGLAYGLSLSLRAGPVEQPCSGGRVNCPRVLAKEHIPPQTTGMDREGTQTHCHSGSSGPEVSASSARPVAPGDWSSEVPPW